MTDPSASGAPSEAGPEEAEVASEVPGADASELAAPEVPGAVASELAAPVSVSEAVAGVVAVIGRPNVGKSTLVNRILGRREAIVQERPGVTRDRKAVTAEWLGRRFTLVDTGGWMASAAGLDGKVSAQAEQAVRDADAVLFVVDAVVGLTADDETVARLLHRAGTPVLVAANKVDDQAREGGVWELLGLGFGDPHPISALHGRGTGDLLDALIALLPDPPPVPTAAPAVPRSVGASEVDDSPHPGEASGPDDFTRPGAEFLSVAIVGRPNAGKSTLFNRLIGEDRSIVHDQPGTTRDAIDTSVATRWGPVRFVDTAGMRHRARIDTATEYYSLVRALRAVDHSDVALLVVDASIGVTHQDQRLAERVDAAGCPVVIVLNKWDLIGTEARLKLGADTEDKLGFLGRPLVLRVSALTGKGVDRLWPSLRTVVEAYRTRTPTRRVNEVVRAAQSAQPAPGGARILYAVQGASDPPTFTLFTNRDLPRPYLRYVERRLREELDLGPTAMKLRVRRRS